jgi:hypothetical protein
MGLMTTQNSKVDPRGPVFISYRQSDGAAHAIAIARLLRAAGVPVWRDHIDLPPGDTNERLREALRDGLSGAILIVTPHIEFSPVVRDIELPELLALEREPAFSLFIANTIPLGDSIDYGAPDALLRRPIGTLSRLDQKAATDEESAVALVRAVSNRRMDHLRADIEKGSIHIDIQTRAVPRASDRDADIPMRLVPAAAGRLPSFDGLRDLSSTLRLLPGQVERSGAASIRVTGRAQLSIALALGCSIPTTFLSRTRVEAADGTIWEGGLVADSGSQPTLIHIASHNTRITGNASKSVLAYVDLVPGRSDDAFARLLSAEGGLFEESLHLEMSSRTIIDFADSEVLTTEIAGQIRALSRRNGNARVHLLLYTPFPIAVLLGRLLNTLKITTYEWNDTDTDGNDTAPHYIPALSLAPTNGHALVTVPSENHYSPEEETYPWKR